MRTLDELKRILADAPEGALIPMSRDEIDRLAHRKPTEDKLARAAARVIAATQRAIQSGYTVRKVLLGPDFFPDNRRMNAFCGLVPHRDNNLAEYDFLICVSERACDDDLKGFNPGAEHDA